VDSRGVREGDDVDDGSNRVGAEFEITTKMELENEGKIKVKMSIFVKWGGMVHFFLNAHFRAHSHVHF
jgi:hypothetical protein